jgi:putative aldouronate transport system substrate-binding protein
MTMERNGSIKGFLIVALCMATIVSLYAGGGKEATSAAKPAGPVQVEAWLTKAVSEAAGPPDDWKGFQIIKEKVGVDLKLSWLPSNFTDSDTKINTAAAANNLPDFFMVNPDTFYKIARSGLLAPVDDLIPLMPHRKEYYNDDVRKMMVTVNGKLYGFPEQGAIPKREGLVIRKDWLEKLGLKVPDTIEEFFNVAVAFTERDPDGNGKKDTYGFGAYIDQRQLHEAGLGYRFDPIFGAFGISGLWDVSNPNALTLSVRKPEFLQAMMFLKKMVDAGVIDPDWPTVKKDEFRARWKQGKFGMMREDFAALAMMSNYKDFDKNFPDGEWLPILPPRGPAGKRSVGNVIKDIRIHAISAKAGKAGKGPYIAKLLDWFADKSPEGGYYLIAFGEEGVNYKKLPDGTVTIEGIPKEKQWTAKEMQPFTQLRNLAYDNSATELSARYTAYKTIKGRTMDPIKMYWSEFQVHPWTEATVVSLVKPEGINLADFTRYYNENIAKFLVGIQPLTPENFQKFVEGLDSLGARKLEENATRQLKEAGFVK